MAIKLSGYKKIENRTRWILVFFATSMVFVVLTATLIFGLLSSTRAFIGYHSLWSHTQNRALIHLISYAHSGEIEEYRSFEQNLSIMDGIQNALYELNMDNIDHSEVEKNLVASSLFVDEINQKIIHLHFLRNINHFREAFDMWEKYHQNSEELRSLAFSIRRIVEEDEVDEFSFEQLLFLAQNMNVMLVDDQIKLLNQLETASATVKRYSSLVLVIITLGVFFIGTVLVNTLRKNFKELERATREKNQIAKYPELNPNPVIVLTKDGVVQFINKSGQKFVNSVKDINGLSPLIKLKSITEKLVMRSQFLNLTEFQVIDKTFLVYSYLLKEQNLVHHYLIDHTERKNLELDLQNSLEEKTLLLGEVHHRVKNNLAIMIALLEIELMNTTNYEAEEPLKRSVTRLHSISSIHKQLYELENLTHIYIGSFMDSLADIFNNHMDSSKLVLKCGSACKNTKMNINQAVPFSMLCNELISAIIKSQSETENFSDINLTVNCIGSEIEVSFQNNLLCDDVVNENLNSNMLTYLFIDQLSAKHNFDTGSEIIRFSFEIADVQGSSNSLPLNYNPNLSTT